jgi:PAS domain S-box-containing protein
MPLAGPLLSRTRWLLAWLMVTAAALAALSVYLRTVYAPRAWDAVRSALVDDLGNAADYRAASVTGTITDAFADVATVADYPSVHLAARGQLPARESAEIQRILLHFVQRQRYARADAYDANGVRVLSSHETAPADVSLLASRRVLANRQPVALPDGRGGPGHVAYGAPIVAAGVVVGAVVLDDRSERIARAMEPRPEAAGARIELAIIDMGEASHQPLVGSSRLALAHGLDAFMAAGTTDETANVDGVAVFVVSRAVAGAPWRLLAATPAADARGAFDARMRVLGLTWSALFAAVTAAAFLLAWGSRRAAEARYARSQARLSMMLDRAHDAVLVCDLTGRVRDANNRALDFYGLSRKTLIGRHAIEDLRPASARAAGPGQLRTVLEDGHLVFETTHVGSGGREVPVEVSAGLVTFEGQQQIVSVVRDVSDRREAQVRIERLNRMLRTVSEVSQTIVRESDASRLLDEVCRIAVEEGGFRFAWIGRKDPAGEIAVVARHGAPGVNPAIEARWDDTPLGRGAAGTAIRESRTVSIADALADARMAPWHERLARVGIHGLAVTPIRLKSEVFGVLTVYRSDVGVFEDDTVRLLEELATDVGFALQAFEDRAARLANEAALAEQRHLFQRITELSPMFKYLFDLETRRYVYANRAMGEVLGYSVEEVAAMADPSLVTLVHPDDAVVLAERLRRFERASDGDVLETEYRMRHRDDTWRWLYSREVVFTRTPDGRPRLVLGVVEDLTGRKQAEEAVRRSETQLRAIFDTAAIGIALADGGARLLRMNGAMQRILGYSLDELNALGFPSITHPDDRHIETALFEDMVAGRRDSYTAEKRNIRKDGVTIWTSVSSTVVRDDVGAPLYYVGLVEDISDRRLLQEQLLQSQKMESIGRLAGGVAHDFNNLLTAIMGYTEMLRQDLPPDHPGQAFVDEVSKAGARAAALTTQLLAFARRQVIEPRVIDLRAVVADAEKMLRRLVGEDIEIVTVSAPDLGAVEADPSQLHQILVNLAVNARDAMPSGGTLIIEAANVVLDEQYVRGHLDVRPGRYVLLSMSDTGVGMSREVQTHLFEPFFTTKELGKGTGLGLATCHGIVKQAGGHITVASEPGHGTTFRIFLPRVERTADEVDGPAALPPLRGGWETLLVAEDEGAVRSLASLTLRSNGYSVLEASTGTEALAIAERERHTIHLLVSDVVMPGLNGRELAERFRALRPGTPVLFISGHAETTIAHQGILEAGVEFLAKPFTPDRLARRVREILDRLAESRDAQA